MNDYIFLMHNDARDETHNRDGEWAAYFAQLRQVWTSPRIVGAPIRA
jgi:hypothetical protein